MDGEELLHKKLGVKDFNGTRLYFNVLKLLKPGIVGADTSQAIEEGKPVKIPVRWEGDNTVMHWTLDRLATSPNCFQGYFTDGWKEFRKSHSLTQDIFVCLTKDPSAAAAEPLILSYGFDADSLKLPALNDPQAQANRLQQLQRRLQQLQPQPQPQQQGARREKIISDMLPMDDDMEYGWIVDLNRTKCMESPSHVVGYPRIGSFEELIHHVKEFQNGAKTPSELCSIGKKIRTSVWKQMYEAGISYIPSNTFSFYDHVLDTTAMLGAVPPRFGFKGGEIGFDVYFSMAFGKDQISSMEAAKWFDTSYYYIVPELGPDVTFSYSSHKAVAEYREAAKLGIESIPVLLGPVSYLLLSKRANGVSDKFDLLTLLDKVLPIYNQVLKELEAHGADWIQMEEPYLVMELQKHHVDAFVTAYGILGNSRVAKLLLQTYFADIPAETYKAISAIEGISAFGFDFVRGKKTLDVINLLGFPPKKYLFAGMVDGRDIWANNLDDSHKTLQALQKKVGKGKLVVSSSCSLMHTPLDLENEPELQEDIKSRLAFAVQKLKEIVVLEKALIGDIDKEFFAKNAEIHSLRRSSPKVTDGSGQMDLSVLAPNHQRTTGAHDRLDQQQKVMKLPLLPTTTIGSFPQTNELRKLNQNYKDKMISETEYNTEIKKEIEKNIQMQEAFGIDVCVHGEPERLDNIQYFLEQLQGVASTRNGWVQSDGSKCIKPAIIHGDVSRPKSMTVRWAESAQSMTNHRVKGILTGPVTILNSSFLRNDLTRREICLQIAMAIKKEVLDLEAAGINIIQIDEPGIHEALPLRVADRVEYLNWVAECFRITNCEVKDTTQIHTHLSHSNIDDIVNLIIKMDPDVVTFHNSRVDELVLPLPQNVRSYDGGIGLAIYDIHSLDVPSANAMADTVRKMSAQLNRQKIWINTECGLKTCAQETVKDVLSRMVEAAGHLRSELCAAT